jgi:hypothetical protein
VALQLRYQPLLLQITHKKALDTATPLTALSEAHMHIISCSCCNSSTAAGYWAAKADSHTLQHPDERLGVYHLRIFITCVSLPSLGPLLRVLLQARGSHLRVHFKNTRETAFALRKMELGKAKRYLEDVVARKRCVPFHRWVRQSVGSAAGGASPGGGGGRGPGGGACRSYTGHVWAYRGLSD